MQVLLLPVAVAAVSCLVAKWLLPVILTTPTAFHRVPPPKPACEGYWPDVEICLDLGTSLPDVSSRTAANAGCPQWRIHTEWQQSTQFTNKLRDMEGVAREWESLLETMQEGGIEKCGGEASVTPPVHIARYRGLAWSRMEENTMAGNSEFHATSTNGKTTTTTCWTDALLDYVEQFGVEPSSEFQAFVAAFDLQGFRDGLAILKGCASSSLE